MRDYWILKPDELSDEQRRVHAAIERGPRGMVAGPLMVLLHSPKLAETAQALGAYCRYYSQLEPRLSELAILTVGAYWKAGYEWTAHAPLAQKAGISAEALEAIRGGAKPVFTKPDEVAVYEFASELLLNHSVSPSTFAQVEGILGVSGVVDLTGILGYYTLMSMLIRAFKIPVPEGEHDPF
jgi:4-carboxymuconolactone decarboxylase